jgi:GAF domain-containing protein
MAAGQEAAGRGSGPTALTSVRRVSDERAYLYELIQTIGAGPDLEAILRGVVGLVTEATGCHACFVYFVRDDGLALRAASRMYEHLEMQVVIPLGEGLTGWVAKTRRSAFIKERALEDPRVRRAYFPQLGDEVYESLVSVPIFARAGEVIGVITLHAEAPHEFARPDLDFLEHTAALISGAVENARLYEDATRRVALLSDLTQLSQRIASAASQDEVLHVVADGLRTLLGASRCEIYLLDGTDRLGLAIANPDRTPPPSVLDAGSLFETSEAKIGFRADEVRRVARAIWGENPEETPLIAPLVSGEERLGLIGVTISGALADAGTALAGVAAHTAVALRQHQVIERLREKNLLKDFFRALARGDAAAEEIGALATRLGCDLATPHVVLHILPWKVLPSPAPGGAPTRNGDHPAPGPSWMERAGDVEAALASRFPGLLVDILERSIRAIVPMREMTAEQTIDAIRAMDVGDRIAGDALSVGVSGTCRGVRAFARGFEEAESAAEIGALIRGNPGVTGYEDLGPYRYVLQTEDDLRDRAQQRLGLLVEYDRKRGAQLLDTLEGYLDHRGNVVASSRALFIHPNTLRQRLHRIERVSSIDLGHEDWLSLAVATKVVKLRRMRRSAGEEGGTDG